MFIAVDPGAQAPQMDAATLHDVTEAAAGVANVLQTGNDACPEAVAGVANVLQTGNDAGPEAVAGVANDNDRPT